MPQLGAALAILAAAGGAWALRLAWCRRRNGGGLILAGWALWVAAAGAWRLTGAAADKALAFALLAPSFTALALVLARAELPLGAIGPGRSREGAVEPPLRGSAPWRGWVRALLAGPGGALTAVALAAAVGLRLPASAAARLAAAGFLLPTAWAAALVWATTDERLGRVALGLGGLALLALAGAWL